MNLTLILSISAVGTLTCVIGILTIALWPIILEKSVAQELSLNPHSKSFESWKEVPIPMYLEFYFFNWTNREELFEDSFKPRLEQLGPYRFTEKLMRVNVTWNENKTVTYQQVKLWHFDPEHSNGSLDDLITTVNVVSLTSAYVARNWGYIMKKSLSLGLTSTGQQIHIVKQVRELLFDGYSDPLINMGKTMAGMSEVSIPYDKFGWFYKRNGSHEVDGVFNMETGEDDINFVGMLKNWNYENRTKFYPDSCGSIRGSAGGMWPPDVKKDRTIGMFSPDLCRSIEFDFAEEEEAMGMLGYRFEGMHRIIDNGTLYPDNTCFCGGECVPSGLMNVSVCRYGAPAFVSYPHFHLADQYYLDNVEGLQPDPSKHAFYMLLEPKTGIPIDVAARFQLNVLLQPFKYISLYEKVPRVFFPLIWFQQRATMSEELASSLRLLLVLPAIGIAVGVVLLCSGLLTVIAMAVLFFRNKSSDRRRRSNNHQSKEEIPFVSSDQESVASSRTQSTRTNVQATSLS